LGDQGGGVAAELDPLVLTSKLHRSADAKETRHEWNSPATIYDVERHVERPCVLVDLSNGGAKIAGVRAHTIPDEFRLRPLGDRRSCRVLWRTAGGSIH
jgi:hypothetical protein